MSSSHWAVYATFVGTECVIGFLTVGSNLLVLLIIYREPKLQTIANCLIGGLASADLIVGAFIPTIAVAMYLGYPTSYYGCLALNCVTLTVTDMSILCIGAIAVERFLAISQPYHHQRLMTVRGAITGLVLVCILDFIVGFIPLSFAPTTQQAENFTECTFRLMDHNYLVYVNFFSVNLPTLVFDVTAYTYIAVVVKKHVKAIKRTQSSMTVLDSYDQARKNRKDQRGIKRMFLVLVVLIMCAFPLKAVHLVAFYDERAYIPENIYLGCVVLNQMQSLINPYLYAFTSTQFYMAVGNIIPCLQTASTADIRQQYRHDGQSRKGTLHRPTLVRSLSQLESSAVFKHFVPTKKKQNLQRRASAPVSTPYDADENICVCTSYSTDDMNSTAGHPKGFSFLPEFMRFPWFHTADKPDVPPTPCAAKACRHNARWQATQPAEDQNKLEEEYQGYRLRQLLNMDTPERSLGPGTSIIHLLGHSMQGEMDTSTDAHLKTNTRLKCDGSQSPSYSADSPLYFTDIFLMHHENNTATRKKTALPNPRHPVRKLPIIRPSSGTMAKEPSMPSQSAHATVELTVAPKDPTRKKLIESSQAKGMTIKETGMEIQTKGKERRDRIATASCHQALDSAGAGATLTSSQNLTQEKAVLDHLPPSISLNDDDLDADCKKEPKRSISFLQKIVSSISSFGSHDSLFSSATSTPGSAVSQNISFQPKQDVLKSSTQDAKYTFKTHLQTSNEDSLSQKMDTDRRRTQTKKAKGNVNSEPQQSLPELTSSNNPSRSSKQRRTASLLQVFSDVDPFISVPRQKRTTSLVFDNVDPSFSVTAVGTIPTSSEARPGGSCQTHTHRPETRSMAPSQPLHHHHQTFKQKGQQKASQVQEKQSVKRVMSTSV